MISIFFSSKCRLFHDATLFGFCITHILNRGCANIKKKIRRQKVNIISIGQKLMCNSIIEQSTRQFARQPSVQVSQNLRSSFLSHTFSAAT